MYKIHNLGMNQFSSGGRNYIYKFIDSPCFSLLLGRYLPLKKLKDSYNKLVFFIF